MPPLSTRKTFKEATIHYLGSLDNRKVLIIIGRENFAKDKQLTESLLASFASSNHCVVWYEYPKPSTVYFLNDQFDKKITPTWWWKKIEASQTQQSTVLKLRKIIKGFILLAYPRHWIHFLPHWIHDTESVHYRTRAFRQFIQSLGSDRSISIIARSAGGRIASTIADEPTIQRIVCLGYPFEHPDRGPEPARFKHLADIKKPLLIIQGNRDEYGGSEILNKYTLSPQITVSFIDTDHDYKVEENVWQEIVAEIKKFLRV